MKILKYSLVALCLLLSKDSVTHADTVTIASWYECCKVTANGEKFKPDGMTAAHKTLPFGTKVKVTNLKNGRSVVVRINDRGPFIRGRGIDLARGAAKVIGVVGISKVKMEIL